MGILSFSAGFAGTCCIALSDMEGRSDINSFSGDIGWPDSSKLDCKSIEENNRMGKTRDLFKKIRDTKEHFM